VVDRPTATRRPAVAWFTSAPAALVTVLIIGALTAMGVTRRLSHSRRRRVTLSRERGGAAHSSSHSSERPHLADKQRRELTQGGHPLARVGAGRQDHVLTPSGRPLCETVASRNWQRTDGTLSPTIPTGTSGQPTCRYCRDAL
jgi:hypothetical protein